MFFAPTFEPRTEGIRIKGVRGLNVHGVGRQAGIHLGSMNFDKIIKF